MPPGRVTKKGKKPESDKERDRSLQRVRPANKPPLKQRIPRGLETVDRNDRDSQRDVANTPVRHKPKVEQARRDAAVARREEGASKRSKRRDRMRSVVVTDAGPPQRDRDAERAAVVTGAGWHYTPLDEARIRSRIEGWKLGYEDDARIGRFENHPGTMVVRRERPPGGPRPMIQPQVGPVGDLRSKVAHTYGFTPEAYEDLRDVPIDMIPHSIGDSGDPFNEKIAGSYSPFGKRIMITDWRPDVLAHEQAHAMYDKRGYFDPKTQPGYISAFSNWEKLGQTPDAMGPMGRSPYELHANPNVANYSRADMREGANAGVYDPNPQAYEWPTELYARTVEYSPNDSRRDWPDEVRPYYADFLQGMNMAQDTGHLPGVRRDYEPLPVPYQEPQGRPEYRPRDYMDWR